MQERIHRLYHDRLTGELEKVFDQYADPHTLIRLDRLEIELDQSLSTDQLETDFIYGVIEAAKRALSEQLPDAGVVNGGSLSPKQMSTTAGLIDLWAFYLEKGYLPWWAPYKSFGEFEAALVELMADNVTIAQINQVLLANPHTVKRFIFQFSDAFLHTFFSHIQPHFPFNILLQAFSQYFTTASYSVSNTRFYFWETVYQELAHTQTRTPDIRLLAQSIWEKALKQIAQDQGIAFRPLVQAASKFLSSYGPLSPILSDLLANIPATQEQTPPTAQEMNRTNGGNHKLESEQEKREVNPIASESSEATLAEGFTKDTDELADLPSSFPIDESQAGERADIGLGQADDLPKTNSLSAPDQAFKSKEDEVSTNLGQIDQSIKAFSPNEDSLDAPSDSPDTPEETLENSPTPAQEETERTLPLNRSVPELPPTTHIPWRSAPKTGEEIYIQDAGLVLVHPFLKTLFESQGLLADGQFTSDLAREKGVQLLAFLSRGQTSLPETELILHKLLCDMPFEVPIQHHWELSDAARLDCENLLQAVVTYWKALGQTSIEGLREGFIQREGKIVRTDNAWKVVVEKKAMDILLGKLPWGIGFISLPWRGEMLSVDWG